MKTLCIEIMEKKNFIEFVADTNGDGNIDVADLARLVGILLKE